MSGKKYYLTPNEFSVISAGFGIPAVYGLNRLDGQMDSKKICIALHNMYVNRLIENKDTKEFIADDEITEIMRIIKAAKQVIIIEHSIADRIGTICCYYGKLWAVIEENFSNPDKIIMYCTDWDELVRNIAETYPDGAMKIVLLDMRDGHILDEDIILPDKQELNKKSVLDKYYKGVTGL